jgi:hypothetical protein
VVDMGGSRHQRPPGRGQGARMDAVLAR